MKRKARTKVNPTPSNRTLTEKASCSKEPEPQVLTRGAMTFEQLTGESDVWFYKGFRRTELFKFVFNFLLIKAVNMRFWKGEKQTKSETMGTDPFQKPGEYVRPGPNRKFTLEQEFLLVMMRLRVGLLVSNLTFRFNVSTGLVSCIFTTWIKLMRKELGWLAHTS